MTRRPAPVVLAAGTVGGAGTTVALRAALAADAPHGAVVLVPRSGPFESPAASSGRWTPRPMGRVTALVAELVGWPRAATWIGFADRVPLVRWRGTPHRRVMVVQNPHLYEPRGSAGRSGAKLTMLRAWARASVPRADAIICSTAASADAVATATGAERERIAVVPIPVIGVERRDRTFGERIERILVVGDLYDYKRTGDAVRAADRFAAAAERHVDVIHLGAERDRTAGDDLAAAISGASSNVTVDRRGAVDHDEVIGEMVRADVLLLTSTTETQGLPLVEALATGLPVVARAIGAFTELGGDAARYVDVGAGPEEFADALHLIDERGRRTEMSARGLELHPAGQSWDLLAAADRVQSTDR